LQVPTYEAVFPPIRQDSHLDVHAFGVNAVFLVKRRHFADGTLDFICFVPSRIIKERDVSLQGCRSFRGQILFVE
jgi:hypothetical protein